MNKLLIVLFSAVLALCAHAGVAGKFFAYRSFWPETEAMKQNMNGMLAMLIAIGLTLLFAGGVYLLFAKTSFAPWAILALCAAVLVAACALAVSAALKAGEKAYGRSE